MTIIAISDTHIGAPRANTAELIDFLAGLLDREDVYDLVLCGDILDFWRCDPIDMTFVSAEPMLWLNALADAGTNIHYIAGNHDYIMRNAESKHKHIRFSTDLELYENDRRWVFLHGWEFDTSMNPAYFDAFCYADTAHGDYIRKTFKTYLGFLPLFKAWRAWISGKRIQSDMRDMFSYGDKPALENISPTGNRLIDAAEFPDGGTVFGHTHLPQLNAKDGLADCGSWHKSYPVHNTYIEIDGETVYLKRFESIIRDVPKPHVTGGGDVCP